MQTEIIAAAITLVLGLLMGIAGTSYLKFKSLLRILDKALDDDKITSKELEEIFKILRR
jgi:type III secretory pathway component EscR